MPDYNNSAAVLLVGTTVFVIPTISLLILKKTSLNQKVTASYLSFVWFCIVRDGRCKKMMERKEIRDGSIQGPILFLSHTGLQASRSPWWCSPSLPYTPPTHQPLPTAKKKKKKWSISEVSVAQIGEGMSRFSMGFRQKAQGAEIFCFCLSFKWVWWASSSRLCLSYGSWSLVRIDLHHLGGAVHAWENKIRDKRTETELL